MSRKHWFGGIKVHWSRFKALKRRKGVRQVPIKKSRAIRHEEVRKALEARFHRRQYNLRG